MSDEENISKAVSPKPKLVLNQHVHKVVHVDSPIGLFNTHIAVKITKAVGSMWCAYIFALIALLSLPSALKSGGPIIIISWNAHAYIQLVLLPIIIVGQNVQAEASDARALSDDETLLAIHTLTSEVHTINNHQTKILKLLDERTKKQRS